ncbi:MAG: threonine-phosphate decarboxylase [Kutzneria sp.]|nr:threonine-phosphate decarboxylase [Kutzneria sp.]
MTSQLSRRALLRHHGDVDATPGLADFAVNVRLDRPPGWLSDRLAAALGRLGRYPSAADDAVAREAVADRHDRHADHVLILNGAAEGFTLLPLLKPRLAAVVHPSFTEPEVALADAGVPIRRVQLDPEDGFRLRPELVPDEADLVVVGNPTNPTSVLHPARALVELAKPGRTVVVDEAFMDSVPGEAESLACVDLPGLLVFRSLTKTWALPGLRVGYAVGRPALLARIAAYRPQWPVGTLALEAVLACSGPAAVAEARSAAVETCAHRVSFGAALAEVPGVHVYQPAYAPFLLLRVPGGDRVRGALRDRGIAVRRGDTFPGLDSDYLRVAVRSPERTAPLLTAMREVLT